MSSWGNNDNSANSPLWGAMTVNRAPTTANQTALFDNTTQNVFRPDMAEGVFGVDSQEASASRKVHTGWVKRTVFSGSGGRAGRIQEEVLVAMNTINTDADEQVYANVSISLVGPTGGTVRANTSNANTLVLSTSATVGGNTSATITYQWQVDNSSGSLGWTNVANGTPSNTTYTGGTTSALTIYPYGTNANTYVYRVVVSAADQGVSATSANASITVL